MAAVVCGCLLGCYAAVERGRRRYESHDVHDTSVGVDDDSGGDDDDDDDGAPTQHVWSKGSHRRLEKAAAGQVKRTAQPSKTKRPAQKKQSATRMKL